MADLPSDLITLKRYITDRGVPFDKQMNNKVLEFADLWTADEVYVRNLSYVDDWIDTIYVRRPFPKRTEKTYLNGIYEGIEITESYAPDDLQIYSDGQATWFEIWWD